MKVKANENGMGLTARERIRSIGQVGRILQSNVGQWEYIIQEK